MSDQQQPVVEAIEKLAGWMAKDAGWRDLAEATAAQDEIEGSIGDWFRRKALEALSLVAPIVTASRDKLIEELEGKLEAVRKEQRIEVERALENNVKLAGQLCVVADERRELAAERERILKAHGVELAAAEDRAESAEHRLETLRHAAEAVLRLRVPLATGDYLPDNPMTRRALTDLATTSGCAASHSTADDLLGDSRIVDAIEQPSVDEAASEGSGAASELRVAFKSNGHVGTVIDTYRGGLLRVVWDEASEVAGEPKDSWVPLDTVVAAPGTDTSSVPDPGEEN